MPRRSFLQLGALALTIPASSRALAQPTSALEPWRIAPYWPPVQCMFSGVSSNDPRGILVSEGVAMCESNVGLLLDIDEEEGFEPCDGLPPCGRCRTRRPRCGSAELAICIDCARDAVPAAERAYAQLCGR